MTIQIVNSYTHIPELATTGFEFEKTPRGGVVYIIEGPAGRVKVGRSSQPRHRVTTVCRSSGVNPGRIAFTGAILNSSEIEAEFKRHYQPRRVNGEWFDIVFDEAVGFIRGCGGILDDAETAREAEKESKRCENGRMAMLAEFYPIGQRREAMNPLLRNRQDAQQYVDLAASIFGLQAAHQLWGKLGKICIEPTEDNYAASVARVMSDDADPWLDAA